MKYILFLSLIIGMAACTPTKDVTNNNSTDLANKKWQVLSLMKEDMRMVCNDESMYLSFDDKGGATLKLSVNSCVGSFNESEGVLSIAVDGCTEACCDSDFDKFLQNALRNINSYKAVEDKLELRGDDVTVYFQRMND